MVHLKNDGFQVRNLLTGTCFSGEPCQISGVQRLSRLFENVDGNIRGILPIRLKTPQEAGANTQRRKKTAAWCILPGVCSGYSDVTFGSLGDPHKAQRHKVSPLHIQKVTLPETSTAPKNGICCKFHLTPIKVFLWCLSAKKKTQTFRSFHLGLPPQSTWDTLLGTLPLEGGLDAKFVFKAGKKKNASSKVSYMDVSENSGTPKSSHSSRVFYYKPSILGFPYFWKHPYKCIFKVGYRCRINPLNTGFSLDALKILILEVILFNHYPLINGWYAQGISPISPTVDVFPASFWQIPAYMFEHGKFETSDNEKINLKKK